MKSTIDAAIHLIVQSSSMVVMTGAGISTDSGIPDFRSPQGLWSKIPMAMGSIQYFKAHPDKFIELASTLLPILLQATPNQGHYALKEMEDLGYCEAIITQNIDGLHQLAGSQTVIEIHGTYKTATCLQCGKQYTVEELASQMNAGLSCTCSQCSGFIKPDVVMFGEHLPQPAFSQAAALVQKVDVMLVAGSSLEVYPASHLVLSVSNQGGSVIIINNTKTALDRIADVIIRDQLSVSLSQIVERLKREEENP
ncbi:MAG: NAD-dependent deacylase [Theionarchaea archaeon]|nr:NAD-dependent deacylase [Theionarchaea archaeon]